MALTRKFLSALGIEDDKVDEIIGAHTETVNALKEQRDSYKADAEKLPTVQKELDDMKAAAEKNGKDAYKVKYDALKEDFDKFKADLKEKEKHYHIGKINNHLSQVLYIQILYSHQMYILY